ncbi:hypothetical protein JGS22_001770 [Streptomyces sp. P38-E01]|uniref:Secreted protein n=1 Tax=Streptomyces tardus TaxID=2780544 RepID=A0A949JDG0_9ACTN|nr:hypothetical protein [Streptomyces tardus]MBU7596399.1 hypothetical protein [Streptomyces tardus]
MGIQVFKARIAAVSGILAASLIGGAPIASAQTTTSAGQGPQLMNWSSSMSGVATGFQSRRWSDSQYSQIWFTGCSSTYTSSSTHVDLRQDRSFQPDRSWGVKKYTACFGSGKSNGEWHNLANGQHFFQITKIDGRGGGVALDVRKVTVDTSKADQN